MFANIKEKESFLKQTNDAREKRQLEKKRLASAIKIQSLWRGYAQRKRFFQSLEYVKKSRKTQKNHF